MCDYTRFQALHQIKDKFRLKTGFSTLIPSNIGLFRIQGEQNKHLNSVKYRTFQNTGRNRINTLIPSNIELFKIQGETE